MGNFWDDELKVAQACSVIFLILCVVLTLVNLFIITSPTEIDNGWFESSEKGK